MKNSKLYIITLYLNFTICTVLPQVFDSSSDNQDSESMIGNTDNLLYSSSKFSPEGLEYFFKHKFNQPKYAEDFLPHNLSDLVQFLQYAKETNQNKWFIKTILRIFSQKFKSLEYLGAKEFTDLLTKLPSLIDYSFKTVANNNVNKIYDILYNEFYYKYQFFQNDPHKFFNNLSEQIYQSIIKNDYIDKNDISSEDLRSMILRFAEVATSKLVWFIEDEPDIWTQFKGTCNAIFKLKEFNIIYDIDEINDLICGALERFIFILDVRGSALPVEFFEKVWDEINKNNLPWLEIEEIYEFMETKKMKLLKTIKRIHAKALARQQYGIIPE